eukprot:scaffold11979_cov108-Isochrysis_galbana.AAC.4
MGEWFLACGARAFRSAPAGSPDAEVGAPVVRRQVAADQVAPALESHSARHARGQLEAQLARAQRSLERARVLVEALHLGRAQAIENVPVRLIVPNLSRPSRRPVQAEDGRSRAHVRVAGAVDERERRAAEEVKGGGRRLPQRRGRRQPIRQPGAARLRPKLVAQHVGLSHAVEELQAGRVDHVAAVGVQRQRGIRVGRIDHLLSVRLVTQLKLSPGIPDVPIDTRKDQTDALRQLARGFDAASHAIDKDEAIRVQKLQRVQRRRLARSFGLCHRAGIGVQNREPSDPRER